MSRTAITKHHRPGSIFSHNSGGWEWSPRSRCWQHGSFSLRPLSWFVSGCLLPISLHVCVPISSYEDASHKSHILRYWELRLHIYIFRDPIQPLTYFQSNEATSFEECNMDIILAYSSSEV